MRILTIGFTRTSARRFFERLSASRARVLVDVRLRNTAQLAGFAKRDDLAYFTQALCGIPYRHDLALAPTPELLDAYRASHDWERYAAGFLALMAERRIEQVDRAALDDACLLCSEHVADRCHRRLVAEYLRGHWGDVDIEHL